VGRQTGRIHSAEFVKAASAPKGYPPGGLPEIAFCGRSNVGKSSLINTLLTRRSLAQTSRTPGKTRTLNFFLINGDFYFVDLPGYGYARISRSVKETWGKMIEAYLSSRRALRGTVLLIDIRHPPTAFDRQMKEWLDHFGHPVVVAATKADKLGAAACRRNLRTIAEELPLQEGQSLIAFSSTTGKGKAALWSALAELLLSASGKS
jgi:GTP-binding protein